VLNATIPILQGATKPGYNDPAAWQSMNTFLAAQQLIKQPLDVTQVYSNAYLPS
jgi:hypothetical protein